MRLQWSEYWHSKSTFFGGAITNLAQLAQLAAYMLLGHQLQPLFLHVRATFIWKSNARAPRFTGFTVNGAPYWRGDLNILKTFRQQKWIGSRSWWFGHAGPLSCVNRTQRKPCRHVNGCWKGIGGGEMLQMVNHKLGIHQPGNQCVECCWTSENKDFSIQPVGEQRSQGCKVGFNQGSLEFVGWSHTSSGASPMIRSTDHLGIQTGILEHTDSTWNCFLRLDNSQATITYWKKVQEHQPECRKAAMAFWPYTHLPTLKLSSSDSHGIWPRGRLLLAHKETIPVSEERFLCSQNDGGRGPGYDRDSFPYKCMNLPSVQSKQSLLMYIFVLYLHMYFVATAIVISLVCILKGVVISVSPRHS